MYLRLCLLGWYIILPGSCKQAEIHDLHALSEIDPHLLLRDGEKLFQYWEIQEQDQLWGLETGEVGAIDAYAKDLKEALGNDAFTITLGKEQSQKEQLEAYTRFDTINNYDLVHEGYLGKIRKINFIEAQILNYELNRFPLFSHPTEFHGFIAKHDSLGLIRIYFAASDQPFPPKPGIIIEHLEQAIENGWYLKYHLHNHYEPDSNNYVGAMAPSLADAQYFKMLKERFALNEALITNGFNTVVLKNNEFEKFNSH